MSELLLLTLQVRNKDVFHGIRFEGYEVQLTVKWAELLNALIVQGIEQRFPKP